MTRSRISSRRRFAPRSSASERWLLLVFVTAFVAVAIGAIEPWTDAPPAATEPLTAAEARASNAAMPIDAKRRVTAAPYRFHGGAAEREQAAECLATAALYEVGDDRRGQRAVIQVILNRVRAPGFPRTVCGVVYQGFERTTGCQFSFTCDGSFRRRRVRSGWGRARRVARRALAGVVFADVGGATHYHADWMVPYWRDTMIKVARVGPHLFYVRGPARSRADRPVAEQEVWWDPGQDSVQEQPSSRQDPYSPRPSSRMRSEALLRPRAVRASRRSGA